jgi:CubicO group peptidase (beta-lactamase class C family)
VFLGSSQSPTPLHGTLHPDFSSLADAFRDEVASAQGGAALCVYHDGECVVDLWAGTRDREGRPWLRDTMAPSFSTTKGVASTLMHIMADRGLVDYDEPVSRYWPEFAKAGKSKITVRQVMSHQAGLYHIRQMIDRADRMLDWDYMVHAIERTRPVHTPGMQTGYHGLTYGFLVGEILQRVTGKSFPELVREELAEPLGLDGLYCGAPTEEIARSATLLWPEAGLFGDGWVAGGVRASARFWMDGIASIKPFFRLAGMEVNFGALRDALAPEGIENFDFGSEETLRVAIPAANGLFTARSLTRMYAALADGGTLDGVRLLSRQAVLRACEVQEPTTRRAVIPIDLRWRLGYHGVFTTRGRLPGAFGHFGFGGSGAWADPHRRTAMAFVTNAGMGTPFGDLRMIRLSSAVASCVRDRSLRQAQGLKAAPLEPLNV